MTGNARYIVDIFNTPHIITYRSPLEYTDLVLCRTERIARNLMNLDELQVVKVEVESVFNSARCNCRYLVVFHSS